MVGSKFGRWTVASLIGPNKHQQLMWRCVCVCGNEGNVLGSALRTGHSQSCGCLAKERRAAGIREKKTTHGHSIGKQSATYNAWCGMWARCTKTSADSYKYYGARGISVCERWESFDVFLADMGAKPTGLVLDRINNDGNYEPENCRWVDWSVSNKNRRPFKRKLKLVA